MNASTPHQPGTAASPRDCPLLQSILATAREMFPGDPWEEVEPHLQRAWKSIAEPVSWEDARPWLQEAWGNDVENRGGREDSETGPSTSGLRPYPQDER